MAVTPEDWEVRKLGDIATIATGSTPPTRDASNYGDEFLFVSPADLGNGKRVIDTQKKLSTKGFALSRRFPKDSILFVSIGSTIGKCGIASIDLTTNQQINAIFPSHNFSTDYLYYAVCRVAPIIRSLAGEQAVPIVNKTQFSETHLPFPSLPEQRAIAAALSDVDALLAKLDQLIAKKRDLKQATMQQLLTGQTRLPGFSGVWKMAVLGNLLTMKATYGIVTAGDFKSAGVPMMRGGDIKGGQVGRNLPFVSPEKSSEYSRTVLKQDDVVIALVGYPGEAAKVPLRLEGANISRAVGLLRLNKDITPDYLVSYLNSPIGRRMVLAPSAGSAQLVVNLADLNRLVFPLPSLSEQTAIATVLSNIDAELAALDARRNKISDLKQGMMQELLTGRVRLV